jgi:ABC transporter substrate binding protein (PQQ-dependent alcohol dehydrogenase system)
MIIRLFTILTLLALGAGPAMAAKELVSFAYLQRESDPAYQPNRAYTGLTLRDRKPPLDGAKTALRESRVLGRALGVKFVLREETLGEADDPVAAIEALAADGTRIFLLDLPLGDVTHAAAALADEDLLLFNIRHGAGELRGEDCSPVLFHTIASDAMRMDGLAQFLFKKNWTEVLILEGEQDADRVMSTAFQDSARKFGLEVVDVRPFVLSNDPRVRDETNIPLLTGDADYDVVFLADTLGEFGRYVPYHTYDPRPVVGSEGLVASAWHWTWERHGAPQLNQRFDRIAERPMTDTDYAAWAAVRSAVEAMVRTESREIPVLRAYLTDDAFTFDTYKGAPGNFRPWDNQLRQAVLLHTHNAVIARAPLEEFLHQTNTLDTLGRDRQETACRFE